MKDGDKIPFEAVATQCRADLNRVVGECQPTLAVMAALDVAQASCFDYEANLRDSPVPLNAKTRAAAGRMAEALDRLIELLEGEEQAS